MPRLADYTGGPIVVRERKGSSPGVPRALTGLRGRAGRPKHSDVARRRAFDRCATWHTTREDRHPMGRDAGAARSERRPDRAVPVRDAPEASVGGSSTGPGRRVPVGPLGAGDVPFRLATRDQGWPRASCPVRYPAASVDPASDLLKPPHVEAVNPNTPDAVRAYQTLVFEKPDMLHQRRKTRGVNVGQFLGSSRSAGKPVDHGASCRVRQGIERGIERLLFR